MKLNILLVFVTLYSLNLTWAQKYKIDPGHSNVQIKVERFGVIDVVGRFKDLEGTIIYDEGDLSKTTAESTIKVDSYDANNLVGEDAVKSVIFLDVANHPNITFESKSVLIKDTSNFLIGDLTIRGVTNEIQLPFTIKGPLMDLASQKQSIAFNAQTTINRQDYGIELKRALPNGIKLVADEVDITLNILAIAE
ncbi:MAG: YceI family protein [Flavobacteriaceae bacterium]|nr:YceI family protein [Bacteroidia bacterium]NNL15330.1 YceI family protein [Flavobacteriaceae bacterium]